MSGTARLSSNPEDHAKADWHWLGEEWEKMGWLSKLNTFNEETVISLMGRDIALYLKFLKYQAAQFSLIFGVSFATLIPMYVSGTDANALITGQYVNQTAGVNATASEFNATEFGLTEKDTGYNLLMLTMLNIQSDK